MSGKKALVALAVITAPAVLGISSAAGSTCREDPSQCGGFVLPCSLDGVNPVHHPHIFGNPAFAYAVYGFVRSFQSAWHVVTFVTICRIVRKRLDGLNSRAVRPVPGAAWR